MLRNVENIEKGHLLPGVHPYGWTTIMTVKLDCGHSYIFEPDEPAFANEGFGPRIGQEMDCIWCDSALNRMAKRMSGHYLVGRHVDEQAGKLR